MSDETYCLRGHLNPAGNSFCASCGVPLEQSHTHDRSALAGDQLPHAPVPPGSAPAQDPATPLPPNFEGNTGGYPEAPLPSAVDGPRSNWVLLAGSLLGVLLPLIGLVLGNIQNLMEGYDVQIVLATGYNGPSELVDGLPLRHYWSNFYVSASGVLAMVLLLVVLFLTITRNQKARLIALVTAPILLLAAVAGIFNQQRYFGYYGGQRWIALVGMAIELAVPVLLLIGALRESDDPSIAPAGAFAPGGQQPYGQYPYAQAPYGQQPYGTPTASPGFNPAAPGYAAPGYSAPGYPTPGYYGQPVGYGAPQTDGMAVAALVLSIVGIFTCLVGSLVGLVLGYAARNRIRESRGAKSGREMATAAIVIGWISIALAIVFGIFYMLVMSASGF